MKIVFLGTNGWYDTDTGNTVSLLIQTANEHIVLDAGNGFYKLDRYVKDDKPVYLFLSHFHYDHTIGLLHTLNRLDLKQGIRIFGPRGTKRCIAALIDKPYTMPRRQLRTKITIYDLPAVKDLLLDVQYRTMSHPVPCYGYRFMLENKVITYCTDTGMNRNILRLADNSDVLITECAFKSGQTSETWGHLNPELAATAARDAGAKKLLLTHFDAALYTTRADRAEAGRAAKKIFRNTVIARDGLSVRV